MTSRKILQVSAPGRNLQLFF